MLNVLNGRQQDRRGEGTWNWDLTSDRISYSPHWAAMLGLSPSDIASEPADWFSRVHPGDLGTLLAALREHWRGATDAFEMEYRVRYSDGSYRKMVSRGVASRDVNGKAIGMTGSLVEITDTKSLESRLEFIQRLTAMLTGKREGSRGLAVLVINGDHLSNEFAERIRAVSSKWRAGSDDRKNSASAALSADQFAVILDAVSSPLQACSIADEMLKALRNDSSVHIGVALSAAQTDAEVLLKNAETAMSSAQAQDQIGWVLFRESEIQKSLTTNAPSPSP